MSIHVAQRGQLWIPYGSGIQYLQYYIAPFSVTNTSYGSGAYGFGLYGSTLSSGTTPVWGVNTPSVSLVLIDGITYTSVASLSLLTPGTYFYSSNVLYVLPYTFDEIILYPDMQNSPTWNNAELYVKDGETWKKGAVYVKVSGSWIIVA